MDSVTARREARRRRILQNSEQRLQKITGVENRSNNTNFQTSINDNGDNSEIDNIENQLNQLRTVRQQQETNENHIELKEEITPFYHAYKLEIITILAITNYCLVLLEISYWNLIFLPFLLFEIALWLTCRKIVYNPGINFLLNFINIRDEFSTNLIQTITYVTQIFQDLMVYFFVFVCCNLIANLSKLIPLL